MQDTSPHPVYGPKPSMRSSHSFVTEVAKAKAEVVRRFFEHDIPLKAASEVHRLFGAEGAIAFKIGERAWTFRFANMTPVDDFFDRQARLQLWFSESAFAEMISGALDVTQAVAKGEVKAKGDIRLLELFGRFLQPGAATLGWDAGT